ncbi:FAD-dependent oxidoreductase [Herbiconiux sp. CPCC 205716]|uniref:FAD-dependent oxidoreductase n=1 Tax=Herbiconiux gentiana TaxID=2970912 RepID=A0ABT2GJI5_9MICO|nr:FAD-dependent oxidoreductase [Herbiconiux gentiana]MCS5716388.1 FAD-dependent oxidoreductase [Herbiconiux gentiana]
MSSAPEAASPSRVADEGVLVVGAGISGLACARALHDAGVPVRVVDRGRVPGGRLATKRVEGRPADIGARYFTVPEGSSFEGSPFEDLVGSWRHRGLVREWTDTFSALTVDDSGAVTARELKTGPMRFAAPGGLRSLATDLAASLESDGVTITQGLEVSAVEVVAGAGDPGAGVAVDGVPYGAVVLAMPDPQAKRMLAPGSPASDALSGADAWEPTLSVVLSYEARHWSPELHGAFVGGSSVLAFVADDGDRQGDGAPVLVAHTTGAFAREHLEHPETAADAVVAAVRALFEIEAAPVSVVVHRWTFANPARQHDEPFGLVGAIGVCGDSWGERSSVSTAWASGDGLGRELARRLAPAGDGSENVVAPDADELERRAGTRSPAGGDDAVAGDAP